MVGRVHAMIVAGLAMAGLATLAGEPAQAQFWPGDASASRPRAAKAGSRPAASRQTPPRRTQQARASSGWGWFDNDDDDDDDVPAVRPQRRSPSPRPLGPKISDGGPRPEIAPSAPQQVGFASSYAAGSIVIDTGGRSLYYVLGSGSAYRYPIAVGRQGFTWTGTEHVSRKADWPDWHPPKEMRERDPRLPEKMTGGLNNPLGAKAIYLGNTLYRIHGTNNAASIGSASSSGCFRMTNTHVAHLSSLVAVGSAVHVMSRLPASLRRSVAGASGAGAS